MSMSDPLGDMLARIKNAQSASLAVTTCPHSGVREAVCGVLKDEGFIRNFSVVDGENNKRFIEIELKYDDGKPVIHELKRISKPGRRIYSKIKDLQPFHNGLGIKVISTPRGVMADYQARNENVGGEVLCQVY
ncbi:MAG: 30S ribosomal protein S8 [Pseudomonadota bacterium]